MKIKSEHFEYIKKQIDSIPSERIQAHKDFLVSPDNTRPPKDLNMRLRWDAFHSVIPSKWVCDNIYPYANNEHLDTVLKKIMEGKGIK